jgi:hypothetical protein
LSASDFVTLIGGPTIPVEALRLALTLESRGVVLGVRDGDLCAGPCQLLTDADRAAIRRWRNHLMALATYQPEPVQ